MTKEQRIVQRDRVLDAVGGSVWGDAWNRLKDKTTLTEDQLDDVCHVAKVAAIEEYDRIMGDD